MSKCRCCNANLKKVVLEYKNMPSSAQSFPSESELQSESGADLKIYECEYCKLLQLDNEPVSYYKDVIRATGFSDEMKKFRKEFFKNFVEKYDLKNKKIIEIGCGKGEYLSMFKEATNYEVYGLENSLESCDIANKIGFNVINGFIENSNYEILNKPYDAFFIMNFLEHIPNPNEFLKGIYNNLSENAIGLVEVPNFDMIFEKNIFSEFIADHLMYFKKDTLKLLLEINGFEVLSCDSIWKNYIISAVVKKKSNGDFSLFNIQQEKIYNEMQSYLKNRIVNGKIAVWGAGHQALANLSLLDMKEFVNYVVDSADFKQGKYTLATHIPIVSPSNLYEDCEVKTVIIMAAAYSNEIYKTIMEKSINVEIAVLNDNGIEILKKEI